MRSPSGNSPRYFHLDVLKTVCIFCVMIWHLAPFEISAQSSAALSTTLNAAFKYFYFQLTLIAVPGFILVSLYLFCIKAGNPNHLKTRIHRIVILYIFWTSLQFTFYYILKYLFKTTYTGNFWMDLFVKGGPELPLVGGSVFYYLFVLFIITIGMNYFFKMSLKMRSVYFSLVLILLNLLYFEYLIFIKYTTIHAWRLDNYFLYIPTAFLLYRNTEAFLRWRHIFYLLFIILSIRDTSFLLNHTHSLSIYGRSSIYFGVLSLYSIIYRNRTHYPERCIRFVTYISIHTLGIFALHKYVHFFSLIAFDRAYKAAGIGKYLYFNGIKMNWLYLTASLTTICVSILLVYLLGKTKLKRFVR